MPKFGVDITIVEGSSLEVG